VQPRVVAEYKLQGQYAHATDGCQMHSRRT
jgi:hypothetical protein